MVGWFEIPVADMNRAKLFYESVFKIEISLHDFGGLKMGWFPGGITNKGASGTLVQHKMYRPSATDGVLIYFSCADVSNELNRVVAAKGQIMQPKTEIGGNHGFMALIHDTEGNRIALHSQV
ncbi:MAG: VOC family protein [Flavobacteriaceae bacterium]